MLATALALLAAAAPVQDGDYRGERVTLTVRDRHVVRARVTVRRFACATFGDVGPLRIVAAPHAPIAHDGRVAFTVGPPSERLALRARFARGGTARGRLRVRGTIATGDPCRSPRVRFVLGWSS
ncbi:MAG TPA: hypothetical protein VFR97_06130 [Capillimicrobium sp.]|nr:hypothetical protein [Capillimicrobium sp.]